MSPLVLHGFQSLRQFPVVTRRPVENRSERDAQTQTRDVDPNLPSSWRVILNTVLLFPGRTADRHTCRSRRAVNSREPMSPEALSMTQPTQCRSVVRDGTVRIAEESRASTSGTPRKRGMEATGRSDMCAQSSQPRYDLRRRLQCPTALDRALGFITANPGHDVVTTL